MENYNLKLISLSVLLGATLLGLVCGNGMLIKPPGRSSRWRFDKSAPVNIDDDAARCGEFTVQWHQNEGKCGLCGDNYKDTPPRANEMGGKYGGSDVIVATYENVFSVNFGAYITHNHSGYISYDLCSVDKSHKESEECFAKNRLKFADGSDKYKIKKEGFVDATVILPKGLSCDHCVLRWTYTAGNGWGICDDGHGAEGCGPQETTKACADIKIRAPKSK
ncbi:uncharacterized protein ACRADG_006794 [Cochliomyia hominivorax]